jgi:dipeptidase E
MKLFLASYFAGVAKLFSDFAECVEKQVLFIPTASIPEKVTFYVDSDKKALAKLGLVVNEMDITSVSRTELQSRVAESDYIFVEGGNTFFLLQELKRSGMDKLIVDHINKGKIYIGASAGSMVLSPNIEYVKYLDKPSVAKDLDDDYSGLGVVDFYIVPHFTNAPFKKAGEKIVKEYKEKLDLRPISNNQVIVVDGDKVEVLTKNG